MPTWLCLWKNLTQLGFGELPVCWTPGGIGRVSPKRARASFPHTFGCFWANSFHLKKENNSNGVSKLFSWILGVILANYWIWGGGHGWDQFLASWSEVEETRDSSWHLKKGQSCGTKPWTCGIWQHLWVGGVRIDVNCRTPSWCRRIACSGENGCTFECQKYWEESSKGGEKEVIFKWRAWSNDAYFQMVWKSFLDYLILE